MSKRVAILSGGEVPGMNLCIKSLVYRLIDLGFEPIGVRKGWEGLINYSPRDPNTYGANFIELTKNIVRSIDRNPGSFLHSSHVNPKQTPRQGVPEFLRESKAETQDLTDHVKEVVQRLLKLIRFRNEYPAFNGQFEVLDSDKDTLALSWQKDDRFCILNIDLDTYQTVITYRNNTGESQIYKV